MAAIRQCDSASSLVLGDRDGHAVVGRAPLIESVGADYLRSGNSVVQKLLVIVEDCPKNADPK